jgi:hypothetical protein
LPGESNEKKAITFFRVRGKADFTSIFVTRVVVMFVIHVIVHARMVMLVGDVVDAEQGFADRRTGIRDRGGRGRRDALRGRRRPAYDGRKEGYGNTTLSRR